MHRVLSLFLFLVGFSIASASGGLKVTGISPYSDNNLKIMFDKPITLSMLKKGVVKSGAKEFFDIKANLTFPNKNYFFKNGSSIQVAQNSSQIARIVINLNNTKYKYSISGKNLFIETYSPKAQSTPQKTAKIKPSPPKQSPTKTVPTPPKKAESKPTIATKNITPPAKKGSKGKMVVVDAGHGGKDCGAMGVLKICEKVIVLKIAKGLESELKRRGYDVLLTRKNDIFLELRDRTAFANKNNADIFISIHANAAIKERAKEANGIETYFLSTARSDKARNVADLENKGDTATMNYFSKLSFLNSINSYRLVASNKLAIDIQFGMIKSVKSKFPDSIDGGVREGPFWVLVGALMPSVLIEIGYTSHPKEGQRINTNEYQKEIIDGIANGIDGYFEKN